MMYRHTGSIHFLEGLNFQAEIFEFYLVDS